MTMQKCPKCYQWFYFNPQHVDHVHQCRESGNSTRMTRRNEEHHQFTRKTIKYDDPNWNWLGLNVPMPNKKIRNTELKKAIKEDTTVNWYIEEGDC